MIERNSVNVTLHDVDPTALRQLIDYAYTGEITITEDNVQVTIKNVLSGKLFCLSPYTPISLAEYQTNTKATV